MPRVRALFVGINEYQAVTPLHGCVQDISAIEALFRERVPADSLDLLVLRDAEATRAAIIDGFRSHLASGGAGDFALFYYCGHGSQEDCPREWRRLEPSGLNQTLVPVDARTGDVFDIADKELNALIHEVAATGAQVVTIFDSCHSGGVTRNADAGEPRMTRARSDRARTLDDYLDLARTLYDPARIDEHGPPTPRHIAIAACQHDETAKEFPRQPPRRGAFSQAFEESLRSLGPSATYADLVTAIRMKVRGRASDQLPNLFVSGGASGVEVFLAGHVGRRDYTVDADTAGRWWLSAGSIDGIPSPDEGGVTEVVILERGAFDQPGAAAEPIARAIVDVVEVDRSRLKMVSGEASLSAGRQYLGAITRLGAPPSLHVVVDPSLAPEVAARVRERLDNRRADYPLVSAGATGVTPPFVTLAAAGDGVQVLGGDGVPIAGLAFHTDEGGLGELATACRHLAAWYGTRDRTAVGSYLNDQVVVELVPVAEGERTAPDDRDAHAPDANGTVVLRYDGGKPPRVQFRLRNTSQDRLFVALLDLTNTFECYSLFADWIPAGATGYAFGGKGKRISIPAWPDESASLATDDLKVFAAITDFDPERWNLPALVGPERGSATRKVVDDEQEARWGTSLLHVEIRR